MNIEQIELRRIYLPYVRPFRSAVWRQDGSHAIIVRLRAEGVSGWGEAPVAAGPWYNAESSAAAFVLMQEWLAPLLVGQTLTAPEEAHARLAAVRGNEAARCGLESAVWDAWGHATGQSVAALLGGTQPRVAVGVSLGLVGEEAELLAQVADFVASGYARVKLKIAPGHDEAPLRAVRAAFPTLALQADANSAYTLADAAQLQRLDPYQLLLLEQPLHPDDLWEHAQLQAMLRVPLCLDESIPSPAHARWALAMGACRVINVKAGRVGGLAPARAIHDAAQAAGVPVWSGGLLETGIGRAAAVALASLPNFRLPGDLSANDRYFARDLVHNPFTLNEDSTLTVPTGPGLGVEVDEAWLAAVTVARAVVG